MASRALTREAVLAAVAECDAMGREAFREHYGYRKSRDYILLINGFEYDSKAIAGVAHKFLPEVRKALRFNQLSGGIADAAGRLIEAGFEVIKPEGNPHDIPWSWEEHVLALALYMTTHSSPPGKGSPAVVALSQTLNRMAEKLGVERSDKFRNPNGVYMKLMNFRRLDPAYQSAGKTGLTRGAKGEEAVWAEFARDPAGLHEAANAIRQAIEDQSVSLDQPEDELGAIEGSVVLRLHMARERNRSLVEKKKQSVLTREGALQCEVCNFDFSATYGALGDGYIEVHHCKPLANIIVGEPTKLSDLAVVCANCHRMLHRRSLTLSLDGLRAYLAS